MNSAITPAYCKYHGYRTEGEGCSICAGTSTRGIKVIVSDPRWVERSAVWPIAPGTRMGIETHRDSFSLDQFLAEVRDSCTNHAERKGYTVAQNSDSGDVFGPVLKMLGVSKDHAFGEIIAKLIEYKKEPRRVLAVKIAGWAWRLWLNTEK